MEWQQIVSFSQVAKLRSFTKAAQATFRTQSAISQQIKALEEELGCQLFERIGRSSVNLTSAGESFLKFAVTLLDSYDQLITEINELKGEKGGRIRLAGPFETLYYLIPNNLQRFSREYPDVELSLIDCTTTDIIRIIRYGEVDFAIAIEYMVPDDLFTVRWKKSERFLMIPVGHPLSRVNRISFTQIVQYPLILPPKSYPIRKRFDEKVKQLNLKCNILIETPNVMLCAECVELGLGISIIGEGLCQYLMREKRKIVFLPLKNHLESDHFALVMRKDKKLSSYQRAFVNIFLDEIHI